MLRPFSQSNLYFQFRSIACANIAIATRVNNSRTFTATTTSKMSTFERITLFNIPKEEDRALLVEEYKRLVKTAVKVTSLSSNLSFIPKPESTIVEQDGEPYITNVSFGPAVPDERSQGYNFGVKTTFATLDDVKFYDAECPAHQTLKAAVGGRKEGPVLTVIFENAA